MNRIIKFRALELGKKHFVYGSLITGKTLNGLPFTQIENADANEFRKWDVASITVGQYTGLTDKNGEEIYEGDIVRGILDYIIPDEDFKPVISLVDETGNVKMVDSCWMIETEDKEYGGGILSKYDSLEVVGNVYQNPELLTAKSSAL